MLKLAPASKQPARLGATSAGGEESWVVVPEPGVALDASNPLPAGAARRAAVVLLHPDGKASAERQP